jgi:16S rRNA (adenine1518-N6/adenine1519-N6)-dimethyltransferase
MIKPKKALGQHFLRDENYAKRIVKALTLNEYKCLLEVGPGTGVLTKHLLQIEGMQFKANEIDENAIQYLLGCYPALLGHIIKGDFLQIELDKVFEGQFAVIGNFPYNISTQIVFKILEHRTLIPESVGMFQREVAKRISSGPGSKEYGILSVLVQAYYDVDYLFTVPPGAFYPPPQVHSGVITLRRLEKPRVQNSYEHFAQVVKTGFNQRRKTLSNALKAEWPELPASDLLSKRAEELSVEEFDELADKLPELVMSKR